MFNTLTLTLKCVDQKSFNVYVLNSKQCLKIYY